MTPPILLLVFNRPDVTAEVLKAIRGARPARLYVAADGPRESRPGEAENCREVRRIATAVDWPCEIHTLFREENLGLRRAVSEAITWFFDHEEQGIILEDDCVPDISFFYYCSELLQRYKDDPRVMCITGDNHQEDMGDWPFSYYFSIFNHCWGWASWRRAWKLYDANLVHFDRLKSASILRELSSVPGFETYFRDRFQAVKNGQLSSWAFVWTWSCWLHGGLTCTPAVNLVSNIGFGPQGTHTTSSNSSLANMPSFELSLPLTHPEVVAPVGAFDNHVADKHYGVSWSTPLGRAYLSVRLLVGRMARAVGLRRSERS